MDISAALEYARERRNGVLATIKRDGRPQLSNISYVVDDGGMIRISVTDDRAKTRNARRDTRVALHITASDFWSYVVIEGDASLLPVAAAPDDATVDGLVDYYRTLAGEHRDWDDYRRAMVADGRTLLIVHPTHAYGMLTR